MLKFNMIFVLALMIYSFTYSLDSKRAVVYSHGFGEGIYNDSESFAFLGESVTAPIYPDAPGNLSVAVFYTRPAVIKLADCLYDKVITEGNSSIVLVGRSCGAGTAINCLEKLVNYDAEYFKDSKITTAEQAHKIVDAINNGAFIATVPLLHLKKVNVIALSSAIMGGLTFAGAMLGEHLYSKTGIVDSDGEMMKLALLSAGLMTYYATSGLVKNFYSNLLIRFIISRLSNNYYDPSHQHPLDAVERLRGKLTCPILLHFNRHDGVLEDPDSDTIKVYKALAGDRTHVIITDDASHNDVSLQFRIVLEDFKLKYMDGNDINLSSTQPTVAEFKKQIESRGIISRIWAPK